MPDEKTMVIEWPDCNIKVEARPIEYNRGLFDAFWESLPFETVQLHAVVTGEDMYAYSPQNLLQYQDRVEKRLRICDAPVGTVSWSGLGLVAMYYGPCTEPLTTQPFARVDDIDALRAAGRAAWESMYTTKKMMKAIFRKKE